MRDKLDGIETRDKIRIRIYNGSDSTIKLERKHKDGPYIQKTSLSLSRQECDALLRGDYRFLLRRPEPFAGQMFGVFKLRQLKPKVLVDYDREPYVFPAEDVRITFDKNVRTAMRATALFDPDVPTYPVMELKNCVLLEVKFNESLPAYIQMLIRWARRSARRSANTCSAPVRVLTGRPKHDRGGPAGPTILKEEQKGNVGYVQYRGSVPGHVESVPRGDLARGVAAARVVDLLRV